MKSISKKKVPDMRIRKYKIQYRLQDSAKVKPIPPTGDGSVISLSVWRFNHPSGGHVTDRCQTDRMVAERSGIKKNSFSE